MLRKKPGLDQAEVMVMCVERRETDRCLLEKMEDRRRGTGTQGQTEI